MKVPLAQNTVGQPGGLPNIRQTNPSNSASDFLDPVTQQALGLGIQAVRTAEGFNNAIAEDRNRQQQQQYEEASEYRVKDAYVQLQRHVQDLEADYSNVLGKDVFEQPNKKPLSFNVASDFNKKREELTEGLDENQKLNFNSKALDLETAMLGRVKGHEAQQYRSFQKSTLDAASEVAENDISLNYNNPERMAKGVNEIVRSHIDKSKLEGKDGALGEIAGINVASNAIKTAVSAAIQHGDYQTAENIYKQFAEGMTTKDRISIEENISANHASDLLESSPESVLELTRASGGDPIDRAANAIASIESAGSGGYAAIGVPDKTGDVGLGRYQVMGKNLPEWSKAALNREVSREEFLNNPKIQDAIFKDRFGKLLTKYGNPNDAASAWLTGRALSDPKNTKEDALGTDASEYVKKFRSYFDKKITGTPFDMMSAEKKLVFHNTAKATIKRNQAVFKDGLEVNIKEQIAKVQYTGPKAIGEIVHPEQFQQAYGDKAQDEYTKYIDQLNYGQAYFSMSKMPPEQAEQVIAEAKPAVGDIDIEQKQKNYKDLQTAYSSATSARNDDPVAWRRRNGWSTPSLTGQNIQQELPKRLVEARSMSEIYKTPLVLFDKAETSEYTKVMNDGNDDDKISMLVKIRDGLNDGVGYTAAVAQLQPNKPSTKIAGMLIGMNMVNVAHENDSGLPTKVYGEATARKIMRGERLLNPGKDDGGRTVAVELPSDFNVKFQEYVGNSMSDVPEAQQAILSAARAYVAATIQPGVKNIDDELLKESVSAIMGSEVVDQAGYKVFPPFGMSKDLFLKEAKAKYVQAKGGDVSFGDVFDDLPLFMYQDNKYAIRQGNGFLRGKDGKPLILDFNE